MATADSEKRQVRPGVPPLQAGGYSFLLRRLHSLTGIFPVGAFLVEHFISNAFATNGPNAYAEQVKVLTGLPFLVWIEAIFIWIPILFHSLYGFYIWYRGESNVLAYPVASNWLYTAQRWTGGITFAYIVFHTAEMRFSGISLEANSQAAFGKVQYSLNHPWILAFYVVGITAASWHFAYGLFLFAAKWGWVSGENGRRRLQSVCIGFAILLMLIGLVTLRAFFRWPTQPIPPTTGSAFSVRQLDEVSRRSLHDIIHITYDCTSITVGHLDRRIRHEEHG